MPALFPEWTNTASRIALAGAFLGIIAFTSGLMIYVRTPYNTEQYRAPDQPVEFDHRHHARDDGIQCLYCHPGAETSPFAGVPSADVCMGCHNQIWNDSVLLEPVRRSYFSGRPIAWRRVHALADFAYFDHSVHVQGGIDCVHCHGHVDRMPRVYRVAPLQMQWCLDCHRDPPAVAPSPPVPGAPGSVPDPAIEVFDPSPLEDLTGALISGRQITRLTTCSACHR